MKGYISRKHAEQFFAGDEDDVFVAGEEQLEVHVEPSTLSIYLSSNINRSPSPPSKTIIGQRGTDAIKCGVSSRQSEGREQLCCA